MTIATSKIEYQDLIWDRHLVHNKYSSVYLAQNKRKDEIYIIKVMFNFKKDLTRQKRYKREIKINSTLTHNNIVKYYGHFVFFNRSLLVTEYMIGGDIREHQIKAKDLRLEEKVLKNYIKQILSALKYIHQHNIIHRDVKPENMLLSADLKTVKLCDFGLSIKKNTGAVINDAVGTTMYLAPEVVKGYNYGFEVDIWSLAVCMFEFSIGNYAFDGDTVYETFDAIKNIEYIPEMPKYEFFLKPQLKSINFNSRGSENKKLNKEKHLIFDPYDKKVKLPIDMEHTSPILWNLVDNLLRGKKYKTLSINDILKHKWFENT